MDRNWLRIVILSLIAILLPCAATAETPTSILLVVAHPDDEYYFAATVYRMSVQLNAQVDEVIITDGEGGYRYSTLAEPLYGMSLTSETVGRKELPAIRRKESLQAGRILGIRSHIFLNQKDQNFTTDEEDGIRHGWNTAAITAKIRTQIKKERYRFVFCILPRASTHGHHQAAAALASVAIHGLPAEMRPVLIGFDTDKADFVPADKLHSPSQWSTHYAYAFDRTRHFGFNNALSYQIVVNWMIAAHKSQGLLQTMCNRDPTEYFWIDTASALRATVIARTLFTALAAEPIQTQTFQQTQARN